jgi:hypothetical protein
LFTLNPEKNCGKRLPLDSRLPAGNRDSGGLMGACTGLKGLSPSGKTTAVSNSAGNGTRNPPCSATGASS